MSNYKDCQIIQLENEELRIRLKALTAQLESVKKEMEYSTTSAPHFPSKVYHLEKGKVGGKTQYTIVDEKGYFEESFFCDDSQKAISFFNDYVKIKKPTEQFVLTSGVYGGVYTSLVLIKTQFISKIDEPTLVSASSYMVYIGKDCVASFPSDTQENEAYVLYAQAIDKYFKENEISQTQKQIII